MVAPLWRWSVISAFPSWWPAPRMITRHNRSPNKSRTNWSRKLAHRLFHSSQELLGRLFSPSRAPATDGACQGFDFAQPVSLSLATRHDITNRMVVRAIRRGGPPRGPARALSVRFIDHIGATEVILKILGRPTRKKLSHVNPIIHIWLVSNAPVC
jgi:hypothetical protein